MDLEQGKEGWQDQKKQKGRNSMIQMGDMNMEEGEEKEISKDYLGEQKQDHQDSNEFKEIPPWTKQITARAIFLSLVIGSLYNLVIMKLSLTVGLVPNLNVSAALVAFICMRTWMKLLLKVGFTPTPFTPQENTVIQTCSVACYALALGGGFGSYLLALSKKIYEQAGVETEGNAPGSYKEPKISWMTGYLFVISFVGLFTLVPLRKTLIIDYKLTYPSGTASGVLINGFHRSHDDNNSKKRVQGFTKFFSISFLWGFFEWFFSGRDGGQHCGFSQFPTFGLKAWKQTFYFNFNMTYVGAGMICPHLISYSLLLGGALSWGLMWPLIHNRKGDWYDANLSETSMKSLQGYKIFIAIALILGDGLYNFLKIVASTSRAIHARYKMKMKNDTDEQTLDKDDQHQNQTFMKDYIPLKLVVAGYITFSIISTIVIPHMFPQIKWYYVVIAYIIAPALGFCNAYGSGLTDMNMAHNYGKVALFVLAAIAGKQNGVVAGLVGCGLIKAITTISSDLMQDLKTGYLTYTSPRSMLISQIIGTAMGCIVAPLTFSLYSKAFDVGNPNGIFKAPFGIIYRNMAIVGVEGFSTLPHLCLQLCYVFFAAAIAINFLRDFLPPKIGKFMPVPMAMAAPFLVGAFFAVDMALGSLIVFIWHKLDKKKASLMVPAVASGLICGDGLWTLPSSILAIAKVYPPICMSFSKS